MGLVTSYAGVDDHGLNQAVWETLESLAAQADYIESVNALDWEKNISFFAEHGYRVVVTVGYELGTATDALASQYPQVLFIGVDQERQREAPNVATLVFPEEQGGFLAGALATLVTKTNRVGAVCESNSVEVVWRTCEGFRAGALYVDESVYVSVFYREGGSRDLFFADPDWGSQTALRLSASGADVIFAYGGLTAQGALLAAAERGVQVIGAEQDVYYSLPALRPALLTSVVKGPRVQLAALVTQAQQGSFLPGVYGGTIVLAPLHDREGQVPGETQEKIGELYQALVNGEFEVPLPNRGND